MIEAERGLGLVLRGVQPLELGLGGAGLDGLRDVAAAALVALADALGLEVRPDEDAVRAPDLEAENVGSCGDAPPKDILGVVTTTVRPRASSSLTTAFVYCVRLTLASSTAWSRTA